MPRYTVSHAMDMTNTSLGVIETDDDDRVTAWHPTHPRKRALFAEAVQRRQHIGIVRGRYSYYAFKEGAPHGARKEVMDPTPGQIIKMDRARQQSALELPMAWDPQQYALFGSHRGRPFVDLLNRVAADGPAVVVDLGCGDGPLTLSLTDRWPNARVIGVDSSPQMLEAARGHDAARRVTWVEASAEQWDPASVGDPIDVLVSNATLQWVPGHLDLLPRWVDALAPGGWFALQVPGNFDAPSHALMREAAARQPRAAELGTVLQRAINIATPAEYLAAFARLGLEPDVWETTYQHVLDPEGSQRSPVLEWVRGTGLRPALDVLTDETERDAFLEEYTRVLDEAYPREPHGVVLGFRRIFAVGHKPS